MIRANFRIRLPQETWFAELSARYPDADFRLLSGYLLDDAAVELGEVRTDRPDAVVAAMRDHAAIRDYELLEAGDDRALGKYETTDTDLYAFVEQSSLPIEFPVVVADGWFEFDLTGTREELDQFRDVLDASPLPYELSSLVSTTEGEGLLTSRQREVLDAAVHAGYFEVPRECTLADLAADLDVDKSTVSTVLRRAESTLVKWYLSRPRDQY